MNDLTDLLDRAAGPADPHAPTALHADLDRGRRALARTRVRRTATGLVGVAAAGALEVGLTRQGGHDDTPVAAVPGTPTAEPTPLEPSGYDEPGLRFPAPPAGWEAQGITASYVTFGQPGDDPDPSVIGPKIHVSLELNRPFGERREVDGRTFWVDDAEVNDHHVTVMTMSEEREGVMIRAQFGKHRWDVESAIAFLVGVQVLDGAQPVRG